MPSARSFSTRARRMYSLGLISSRSAASRIALVNDRGARTCKEFFGDASRSVLMTGLMMVSTYAAQERHVVLRRPLRTTQQVREGRDLAPCTALCRQNPADRDQDRRRPIPARAGRY